MLPDSKYSNTKESKSEIFLIILRSRRNAIHDSIIVPPIDFETPRKLNSHLLFVGVTAANIIACP